MLRMSVQTWIHWRVLWSLFRRKLSKDLLWSYFSKACQYVAINEKVCRSLKYVFIKYDQAKKIKCIIWPIFFYKGCQKWNKVCIEASLRPIKLNIAVKTRSILLIILVLFHFVSLFFSLFWIASCFVDLRFIVASLQIKSYCFSRHYNLKQQLFFVIVNKL
jgi:hypothetical protein